MVMPVAMQAESDSLPNGGQWIASDGKHINAHGGCVLYHDGMYYMYGEERPAGKGIETGVSCYSSPDMLDWQYQGTVLKVSEEPGSDIEAGCIIERPKVVFNEKTGKFVMWFHLELKGKGYEAARAGVAVSDSPSGPFEFLKSGRVNPRKYPLNMPEEGRGAIYPKDMEWWTPEWYDAIRQGMFTSRDFRDGQMSRDQTVFVDDDGKAYHIYSSEDNLTLQIAELNDEYTDHTGKYIRIFPAGHNEAPAIFKHGKRYWMITSGCTGWAPNEARLMTATDIMGEWEQLPNPCVGPDADVTFKGQSNYIMSVPGDPNGFIAMFDIWNPKNLADSRFIWLPITFGRNGVPEVEWQPEFKVPETILRAAKRNAARN